MVYLRVSAASKDEKRVRSKTFHLIHSTEIINISFCVFGIGAFASINPQAIGASRAGLAPT